MWTPRSPEGRHNWFLPPWMPLGKQGPHNPKWSRICRPEWHLFFPQQGSTFSYFTSRGDICHRKWIRGLVFLRWHSSIGRLRLHTSGVKTNRVLLGHLAVGGGRMVLAWPVALLASGPRAPSSHSCSMSIQKNWVAQWWDHMIAYFSALGSKKENGKKKKKKSSCSGSVLFISCRITLPESACTISRVIPSQERPSLATRSIYPVSFRSTVVMRSFVATYLKAKGFCVLLFFFLTETIFAFCHLKYLF